MLPRPDALTADPLPAEPAEDAERRVEGKRWRLAADAPEPDIPTARDRRGARRGLLIVMLVGGLFWVGVAALVLFLRG